jgi:hypothetical protein
MAIAMKEKKIDGEEQRQKLTRSGAYVRFEVFTAVTMMNVVFWGITTQFVPHRRHITSPLQSPVS